MLKKVVDIRLIDVVDLIEQGKYEDARYALFQAEWNSLHGSKEEYVEDLPKYRNLNDFLIRKQKELFKKEFK